MSQLTNSYNLEERTAKFGGSSIKFCRDIKPDVITIPLISQLIRSATSIGANYMEANAASSKKDFRNKISICKKEAQETRHWLRMIAEASPSHTEEARKLWKECQELVMIFQKISSSMNRKV